MRRTDGTQETPRDLVFEKERRETVRGRVFARVLGTEKRCVDVYRRAVDQETTQRAGDRADVRHAGVGHV